MIFLYGAAMALLVLILKWLEYRFLAKAMAMEIYLTLVAIFFTALGSWIGYQLTFKKNREPQPTPPPDPDNDHFGLSKREKEVLHLMSQGLSNQEIADTLFVSLNTVKTHSSNIFNKLEVKRRTQAVKKAKDLQLV